ncbi:MAG: GAF domain-containing protein [Candidatus Thermoplasmatota archaeon]|jgi:GAF domain-containing protein|nr:GAF domain-containing protein [Candidatus Thermoplasmatota archaeon]
MKVDGPFMKTPSLRGDVLSRIGAILQKDEGLDSKLLSVCKVLSGTVPHYDWVGFYLVDPEKDRELVLGPFVGAPTEHVRIPFGKGICGQAAATGMLFLVPDVLKEGNYLSCSPDVRSEIVVPILDGDRVLGELDIDSHMMDPFDGWDRELLGSVCHMVGPSIILGK